MELLPSLPVSSFIHIDPYEIDKSGEPGGFTYFDVFLEAVQAGIKCYLWYGFMTLSVKEQLNAYILNGLRKNKIKGCACVELILEIIERNTIPCNPGILGSGILTAIITLFYKIIVTCWSICIREQFTTELTELYTKKSFYSLKK